MTRRAISTILFVFLLPFCPSVFGQFTGDSPAGLSAGLAKLFGTVTAFSARADVQVLDNNQQETLRTPMAFALLDGKMRMDIDMSQMKGRSVPPGVVAALKQAGLDRVNSIVRLDRKVMYLVFTGARSYVDMGLSASAAEVADKNLRIQKTLLGREALDGHACAKNKVVVKNSKGVTLLEATTWNASDMKDFPLQIALQAKDNATVVRFSDVQFKRPPAAQFDPPSGYAKFRSPDALLFSVARKANAPQTQAAAPKSTPPKPASPSKAGTGAPPTTAAKK